MVDDITINVGGEASSNIDTNTTTQTVNETVAAPKATTKKQGGNNETITLTQTQLDAMIAVAVKTALQTVNQTPAQNKEDERTLRGMSKVGIASRIFAQKMDEEIKNGQYKEFDYWPALAQTFGSPKTIGISGYNLTFIKGRVTKVPKSLYPHVEREFNLSGGNESLVSNNLKVFDATLGQYDDKLTDDVASALATSLHRK